MASGPPFPPPYDSPSRSPLPHESGQLPVDDRWLTPAVLPAQPGILAGTPVRAAMYELRPLSTGEVLDRTFSLYRSRFLLFAGIASLSATVQLIGQVIQLLLARALAARGNLITLSVSRNLLSIGVSILFLLAFAVTQAATVWAVGEVYLGRSTTVVDALRATTQRWLRYLGIALWQMGSAAWPALAVAAVMLGVWLSGGRNFASIALLGLLICGLLAAIVLGFIFYLRNLLAVPITVREGSPVRPTMRRSKLLSAGAKGKLFLVLLVAAALYYAMGILIAIAAGISMFATHSFQKIVAGGDLMSGGFLIAQIIILALSFVTYTFISPIVMIGITLVYFDQRVRKEAFDVAVLLGEESVLPDGAAAVPTPPSMYPVPAVSTTPASSDTFYSPSLTSPPPAVSFEQPSEPAVISQDVASAEPRIVEPPEGASGL